MVNFKRILVPLDGSQFAEAALEPAPAIARAMGAELVLFRVAQPIPRTQKLTEMPDVYRDVRWMSTAGSIEVWPTRC